MTCRGFVAALVFGCALHLPSVQASAQTVSTGSARYVADVDYARWLAEAQTEQGQLMLRFQLIEASSIRQTAARDPAIAAIDTVLRDLFRYSNYQLVSEAVVASAATNGGRSSLLLSGGNIAGRGETYQLDVTIYQTSAARGGRDASLGPQPPPVQIAVSLKEVPSARTEPNTGNQMTLGSQGTTQTATANPTRPPTPRTVLETTVTMSPGHTVVLGSTQPGGPGPDRTLILVMRPEIRKY